MSDYIIRESVLNTIEDMDKALDTDRTVEEYKALLIECIKALPSRDSITELEKIKAEIKEESYSIINIDGDFYDLGYRIVDIDDINEIIVKHISELKGEQE